MAIDPGFPVFLKKMVLDPLNGNIYPALSNRAYQPGELPRRFLTEEYCSQEGLLIPKEIVVDLRMPNTEAGAQIPVQLRPTVMAARDLGTPAQVSPTVPIEPPTPPISTVVEATVATGDTTETPMVHINHATESDIINALKGVGAKTAEKLVQERSANGVFASITALDDRAPLPFGRKWEEFITQLTFE